MVEGFYKRCNDFLTATVKMWILTKHSALLEDAMRLFVLKSASSMEKSLKIPKG